ncbi:unnamed protein product [Macrosiphum euphorbiae]|uniref:C2H2-type domain-containing protein n=1 Tax=Macrosiphum euphorbiae TaxID=13131 RepID=A0AAV0WU34_9HEMI|nr:unnamed protein product [Macrosiphum euphorbiae]
MFQCTQCSSEFTRKDALVRHGKTHTGIRFPCSVCPSIFTYKTSLTKHLKNVHGFVNVPAHRQPNAQIDQPVPQIQIGPQIFVPDVPAGGSNMMSEDDICMAAMDEFEDTDSYTVPVNGKRVSTANTVSAARAKKN